MAKTSPNLSEQDSISVMYKTLDVLMSEPFSEDHKRDLKACVHKFLVYLVASNLYNKPVSAITSAHVQDFLAEFLSNGKPGVYFINNYKRLNIIFSELKKNKCVAENVMSDIRDAFVIENSMPKYYFTFDSLEGIFAYIREKDFILFLMFKFNYFLFLKFNIIRSLTRSCFDKDFKYLKVNSSKGELCYKIPPELTEILISASLYELLPGENIFTKSKNIFSASTFFKAWARIKLQLKKLEIIQHEEYDVESFANTHIYKIYSENGDVFEIQRLLNFASTYKTKQYLKDLFGEDFSKVIKKRIFNYSLCKD
jgi:hypothetical protein